MQAKPVIILMAAIACVIADYSTPFYGTVVRPRNRDLSGSRYQNVVAETYVFRNPYLSKVVLKETGPGYSKFVRQESNFGSPRYSSNYFPRY